MELELGFKTEDIIKELRTTRKEIEELQNRLKSEGYDSLTDQQVVQFILTCDNNLEFARNTIKNHFKMRASYVEFFVGRDFERADVQNIINVMDYCIMPKSTKEGHQVLLYRLKEADPRTFELGPALKLLSMMVDTAIYDYPPSGLIILVDLELAQFMHVTKIRLGLIKKGFHCIDGLPVKIKSIHLINANYLIDKLFHLIKPFMNDAILNKFYVHSKSTDWTKFYEDHVERACLPSDYGGLLQTIESINVRTIERIKGNSPFFRAEDEQIRCIAANLK